MSRLLRQSEDSLDMTARGHKGGTRNLPQSQLVLSSGCPTSTGLPPYGMTSHLPSIPPWRNLLLLPTCFYCYCLLPPCLHCLLLLPTAHCLLLHSPFSIFFRLHHHAQALLTVDFYHQRLAKAHVAYVLCFGHGGLRVEEVAVVKTAAFF